MLVGRCDPINLRGREKPNFVSKAEPMVDAAVALAASTEKRLAEDEAHDYLEAECTPSAPVRLWSILLVQRELGDLEWLRGRIQQRDDQRRDNLDGLKVAVARARLAIRSST